MPAAASEAFSDYRKFAQDAFHNNITLKQTKHLCSEDYFANYNLRIVCNETSMCVSPKELLYSDGL